MYDFFWDRAHSTGQGDLSDIIRCMQPGHQSPSSTRQLPVDAPSVPTPFSHPFADVATAGGGLADDFAGFCEALLIEQIPTEPLDVLSRRLQISPSEAEANSPVIAGDDVANKESVFDRSVVLAQQRTPGIKRRKGQAKKVVCIPAPTAPSSGRPNNSISGGEVVPSDLWAWRKYGQKPIKGSPYPRGYYRCSSSKGCSARKQVERSRTDPNMLVITYTSEHNHPWPTQRNALAGSTRSSLSKNNSSAWKMNPNFTQKSQPVSLKIKESNNTTNSGSIVIGSLKEETMEPNRMDGHDLFVDLAGIEMEPISLVFSKGLMDHAPAKPCEERREKDLQDPFSLLEWFGETKNKDL